MKILKINKQNTSKEHIEEIVSKLLDGKIVVLPTDTIYGFHCLADNDESVRKVVKIKNSKDKNGILVLMKSYCMLHDYCFVSKKQDKYIRTIWPPTTRELQNVSVKYKKQATTFIFKSRCKLSKIVNSENEKLAVRLPKDDFLITILKKVNKPIISTSFNVSGKPVLNNFNNLDKYFTGKKPDLIVDAGKFDKNQASKLIDISDINNIKVIR